MKNHRRSRARVIGFSFIMVSSPPFDVVSRWWLESSSSLSSESERPSDSSSSSSAIDICLDPYPRGLINQTAYNVKCFIYMIWYSQKNDRPLQLFLVFMNHIGVHFLYFIFCNKMYFTYGKYSRCVLCKMLCAIHNRYFFLGQPPID